MLETSLNTAYAHLADSTSTVQRGTKVTTDEQALEVSRQFEALLIQTMLKNMRAAAPEGGLFDSEEADMYMEMFDQKISEEISHTGGFGIQESIYRQLTGQGIAQSAHRGMSTLNAVANSIAQPLSLNRSDFVVQDTSPGGFINRLRAAASETADKLGTSIEAVLAVAALETGWGKRVATTEHGKSTHNLFGIKADERWQGESTRVQTHEYKDGRLRSEQGAFRVYQSEQDSIRDFGVFLSSNPRYQSALNAASQPEQFIRELQKAGYATDPDYADKVISVMQSIVSQQAQAPYPEVP